VNEVLVRELKHNRRNRGVERREGIYNPSQDNRTPWLAALNPVMDALVCCELSPLATALGSVYLTLYRDSIRRVHAGTDAVTPSLRHTAQSDCRQVRRVVSVCRRDRTKRVVIVGRPEPRAEIFDLDRQIYPLYSIITSGSAVLEVQRLRLRINLSLGSRRAIKASHIFTIKATTRPENGGDRMVARLRCAAPVG